ncbi:ogr/Delta-like zinc finger family protein [Acinetobacter sp. A47]|uniref:ogr/Delta-like zinc finger family protein n=1 Tax=Acinetobacter sp. A47 TaxID=1561217 RepID=UPI00056EA800|nr:ogr/Delta-like zinc finger family protein [Acinetobacter sp. A47]
MQTETYNRINKNNGRPQINCPHCQNHHLKIRSSQQKHPLLKEIRLQCPNFECSFSCVANIELMYTVSPSGIPNPSINLPTFKVLKQLQAANDEMWRLKKYE